MPRLIAPALISLALVLVVSGCATTNVNLPSITSGPTDIRAQGKIIWHDLLTNDPGASQTFYSELFGWEFEDVGTFAGLRSNSAYTLIRHNGIVIGGMVDTVALNGRSDISQWVTVMSVNDVDEAVDQFRTAGGKVVAPPTDVGTRGRMSLVRDAEGALLAVLQTRDGDPADREPEMGGFLWDELWTTDVEGATRFYTRLTGLQLEDVAVESGDNGGRSYRVLKDGDRPRAGVMHSPLEGLDPVWVNYLRVADPATITARVPGLGGAVIVEAQPRPLGGEVAFIAGPSGAAIALQTWPLN
jgi:predicted enzyme related to lactoylglutathione lyase